MNGHIELWIDQYLDGELQNGAKRQVETHLEHCGQCQALLAKRRRLSSLLREAPCATGLKPQEQFAAEVGLQLARRGRRSGRNPASGWNLGWLAFPVFLLLGLAFLQTVAFLSYLISAVPGMENRLAQAARVLPALPGLRGAPALETLDLLGFFNLPVESQLGTLALMAGLGVLYMCWLAGWWAHSRQANPAGLETKEGGN